MCEGALDIHPKGLRSGRAQIVIFPGERRHTERCIYTLIKEPSEPLESIQQGAHSPRQGCQGTEPCPQAPGWGPMLNGPENTAEGADPYSSMGTGCCVGRGGCECNSLPSSLSRGIQTFRGTVEQQPGLRMKIPA